MCLGRRLRYQENVVCRGFPFQSLGGLQFSCVYFQSGELLSSFYDVVNIFLILLDFLQNLIHDPMPATKTVYCFKQNDSPGNTATCLQPHLFTIYPTLQLNRGRLSVLTTQPTGTFDNSHTVYECYNTRCCKFRAIKV